MCIRDSTGRPKNATKYGTVKKVLVPTENLNEIVNALGDAAPSETTVSGEHSSLNVVVLALKMILAVDVQKVQQKWHY